MVHSPNLNVMVKALDKISDGLARDFAELENLQTNSNSAIKFANSSYKRIETDLVDDLLAILPEYSIRLASGKKINDKKESEYQYFICPIDGLFNLSRALPAFGCFIGLSFKEEFIAAAFLNIAANEICVFEKGSGVKLNNKRLRVSNRRPGEGVIVATSNSLVLQKTLLAKILPKNSLLQISNCPSLDLINLAIGKVDICVFSTDQEKILAPLKDLAIESGAKVTTKNDLVIISNSNFF